MECKNNGENRTKKNVTKTILWLACFFVLSVSQIQAQTRTISGTVTDEENNPLIGVTVSIVGTTTGTMTDLNGKYSIQASPGQVLDFSYVGMKPQQITVDNQSVIDIRLIEDATMLAETVVIGYGTARKLDLTGSIANIDISQISDRPSSNPLASLQGKVAGVQVVNTGRAGQDPEIRIRGVNSINGYAPLYVVDGLFSDNINYLNPADIESMSILKDPSSLAIFGVRGANGVIIITTKRAQKGQTDVNINSSIGFRKVTDRVSLTNADQFKELYSEQLQNQQGSGYVPFDYTNWPANTDWQDEIFQTGFITNNNVSITGATEKSKFYLGIGYVSEEGSIKSEKFSKITINLNSEYNVTKSLKFGYQINGARSLPPDAKDPLGALKAAPVAPVYGTYTDPKTNVSTTVPHILPGFQAAQVANPIIAVDLQGAHNKATNYRMAGNVYGELDFLNNFNFKATFSLDYANYDSRQFIPIVRVYNPDVNEIQLSTQRESINQTKENSLVAQQDYILSYSNNFSGHGISATAGITTNYRQLSSITAGRSQHIDDIVFPIPDNSDKWWITSIDQKTMTNSGRQFKRFTMSYLLRALYNYNNRYLFNASYRRDGSSAFRGTNNTWDNFYSFGAGWLMSEEDFMKEQKVIDYLKVKASWGVLGSENTGGRNYPSYPTLSSSGSAVFGDEILTGYSAIYLVQNLRWEKTYSWEAGFEMNLLDNRLRIEPTYYSKITKDLIVLLESRTGAQNSLENLGEIENKGVEISANWSDKIGDSGFNYSVGANITTINNKVKSLGRDEGDAIYQNTVSRSIAGEPVGYFYGYKVIGVYQNNEQITQSTPVVGLGATPKPGDLMFADVNNDGEVTPADRTLIGNPTPDFTYGLNLNLSYKGFDLGVDVMGVYGNEIYRNWDINQFAQFNYRTDRLGRWNGEGTSNWEPILDPGRTLNFLPSSYYIEDGSFFRIRNVQLGYTFDSQFLQKARMKSLRLFTNIQNLKTWSKNSGYTPEIGGTAISSGIDSGSYPMPVIYTFGFNLTF